MSIQTEINRITAAVGAAYDAVETKGGTVPQSETVAGLAEAIGSIPAQSDQSLGITSAEVGQIAKITAVDDSGKPTAWEAVDLPSGGGDTWEKIADVALTTDTSVYEVANFGVYRKVKVLMYRAAYVSGLNKNVWFRIRPIPSGAEIAGIYMGMQYGYLAWEVNAEVDTFVYMSRAMTNNNAAPSAHERTVGILTPTVPSNLKLNIEFTDTSVIQDGDTVAVYGVKR